MYTFITWAQMIWTIFIIFQYSVNFLKEGYIIEARVHNNRGGGERPIFYTAAKHTVLSYDTIGC